jgi:hypothetical protein
MRHNELHEQSNPGLQNQTNTNLILSSLPIVYVIMTVERKSLPR